MALRWTHIDGAWFYSDPTKPWGHRTKAEVFRVGDFGAEEKFFAVKLYLRTERKPMHIKFDERDDALKYVETVVALQGE